MPVIRLNLDLGRRDFFSEKSSGTLVNGVEAPTCGGSDSFPSSTDLLVQIKQIMRTEIGGPSTSLTYRSPYLDHVAASEWPKGYKPIKFTTFAGEGSEDAATNISRF